MVKALSTLIALVTLSFSQGCAGKELNPQEALSYCSETVRTVAIDSSFSAGRVEAIVQTVSEWQNALGEVVTLKVEMTNQINSLTPCTYMILNRTPGTVDGRIGEGTGLEAE